MDHDSKDTQMQRSILVAAGLILTLSASAETLDAAWEAALASHRQIAVATANSEAAAIELEQARAGRLPAVGLMTRYTRLDTAPSFEFGEGLSTPPLFSGDDFVQAGAEIRIPLYTGGATRASVAAAAAGADAAAEQLAAVTQDIKLGVAEHYVAVLRAESAVDVAKSLVASLRTHAADTKNRLDVGAVPRNEYLATSVTLANAEQRLLAAGNALDYARAAYNRALGRSLDAPVTLDPNLGIDRLVGADETVDSLVAAAVTRRPELAALERQGTALREGSDAVRAATRPRLALTSGYQFLENEFLDDDAFWMTGLSVQWNLFDGGRSRKQAAALDRRAAAVGHQRSDLESMIALEVRRAFNDRNEAESRLDVATAAVAQADENLRVVRNRYVAGASTNVEVLDAEALREQSLSNLDNARFEVALAKLRLARAAGAL